MSIIILIILIFLLIVCCIGYAKSTEELLKAMDNYYRNQYSKGYENRK